MGSDMSYAYVQADAAATERRNLTNLIDQLQAQVANLNERLDITEKAYDRALQENLDMADQLRAIKATRLVAQYRMGLQGMSTGKDIATKMAGSIEEEEQAAVIEDLLNQARAKPVVSAPHDKTDVWDGTTAAKLRDEGHKVKITGHKADVVIIDDPLCPDRVEEIGEELKQLHKSQIQTEALKKIRPLMEKTERAVGQRAQMKDTLVRTQNACRRYKARLKRQKVQLEALQTLADKAFPLYLKLSDALAQTKLSPGVEFLLIPRPKDLEQQCIDFHNAFNEAAEALTPEDRHDL